MWQDIKFWKDSTWRAFRTFCQTLAAMLVVVQTSAALPSTQTISVPWQAYIYASAIAGLISLLQSIDRERAVGNVLAPEPVAVPAPPAAETSVTPLAFVSPGCGGDQR